MSRIRCLVPLFLLALFCVVSPARAGNFTAAPWTNDASTNILSGPTLWAYHFGAGTTTNINGVTVSGIPGPTASNGDFDLTGTNAVFNNDTNTVTGGGAVMAHDFVFGGKPATVTLKNLVAGANYTLSFYSVGWQGDTAIGGNRFIDFTSDGDNVLANQDAFGLDNGIRIDYHFAATAATKTITAAVVTNNATLHLYGLSLNAAGTTVTNTNNSGAGSLRQALVNAAAFAGANTVDFTPGVNGGQIKLSSAFNDTNGILIHDPAGVTVDANNLPNGVTITLFNTNSKRVMAVTSPTTATLRNVAITGGNAFNGGGVYNSGNLTLENCRLAFNAGTEGGAINNDGTLSLKDCTITNHSANTGGGIYNSGTLSIAGSTFTNDNAGNGGAIYNSGTLSLTNSTLANNGSSEFGGAIHSTAGSATLLNCTLSGNASSSGAAIYSTGGLTLNNTLVAGNSPGNVVGAFSGGNNLTSGTAAAAGLETDGSGNPVLKNNGGRTDTVAIVNTAGTAYNSGSNAAASGLLTDQRGSGFPRIAQLVVDIGAYEYREPDQAGPSFVVNKASDHDDGACSINDCTLREAVNAAEAHDGFDTITFVAALSGQKISLGSSLQIFEDSGGFAIDATALPAGLTIDDGAATLYRLILLGAGQVQMRGLTFANGGGSISGPAGGAIFIDHSGLTVTKCTFTNNIGGFGGAIYNAGGRLTATQCTFSGNSSADGGAIFVDSIDTNVFDRCTFSGNTASGGGGAVFNFGTFSLLHSTLAGNSASYGGAIDNAGTVAVTHCTITGNSADLSSAIYVGDGTGAPGGGGSGSPGDIDVQINYSIIVGNSAGDGVQIDYEFGGEQNIVTGTPAAAGLQVDGSGKGLLKANGGPTKTIALLSGSPAIDAATNSAATSDQRGFAMLGEPDIGAFERQPTLSISDATITEGNSGAVNAAFTVTLATPINQTVKVNYATGGTATNPATVAVDYTKTTGTLTFNPGTTSLTVNVPVIGDTLDENNETFAVNLSGATGAAIADAQGLGTITDDDATPSLAINDASRAEGSPAQGAPGTKLFTFTVTLSKASGRTVTVNYGTANGTATEPGDYTKLSGTLSFAPGQTTKTVNVTVIGDTLNEPDETFKVNLTAPANASIADAQGIGTIVNDDALPSLTIANVSANEGHSGTKSFMFTVALSAASGQTVTVNYGTANGTATAPSDYATKLGTLTFAPGQTTRTIPVLANGDTVYEPNETFNVNLNGPTNATIADGQATGTILNDDAAPSLSINDVSVVEGNSGSKTLSFTVTLSAAATQTVKVNYATADGTATQPGDYTAASGTLSFPAGTTSKVIVVATKGDTAIEPNETLFVNLTAPVNATIARARGTGTITNDDGSG